MFFQYPLLQSKDYNISISYSSVKIKMDNPFKLLHNTYQSILRVQQMLEWIEILLRQVPPGGAMSYFSYLIVLIPKIFFLPSFSTQQKSHRKSLHPRHSKVWTGSCCISPFFLNPVCHLPVAGERQKHIENTWLVWVCIHDYKS